jgi:hypothetical protein
MDASKYIKELKQKVVMLNQEIACAQDSRSRQNSSYPTVRSTRGIDTTE